MTCINSPCKFQVSYPPPPSTLNPSHHLSLSTGDLFTEAAEAAMEAMKGRSANQYYMKAEEAWALMEE